MATPTIVSTVIVTLILLTYGLYAVVAYVSSGLGGNERASRYGGLSMSRLALWLLLVTALCPWFAPHILGSSMPSNLGATHKMNSDPTTQLPVDKTSTALPEKTPTINVTPQIVPTPTQASAPKPLRSPTPAVVGTAVRDLKVYLCPGQDYISSTIIPAQKQFTIIGWNESGETKWYLIQDNGTGPQQWVTGSVRVNPPNYSDYIRRATCRVTK